MLTRIIGLLALALVLGPGNQQTQKASVELPTVDQILSKYVSAVGGEPAIVKIKTLSEKGSISLPAIDLKGAVEIYRVAPNKYLFSSKIIGFGSTEECFDGKIGWSKNPRTGLRELSGTELGQMKRESDIYAPLHLKQMYSSMSVEGEEKVGTRDAYVISASTPEAGNERIYFDALTGLLVRLDRPMVSPLGSEPMQIFYEDYREAAGLRLPFEIRQVTPGITTVIALDEVKANVPIDDSKFTKPKNWEYQ